MKQITVSITSIANVSTIQMKYNERFVVENVVWRNRKGFPTEPRFPFMGLLKAFLRVKNESSRIPGGVK